MFLGFLWLSISAMAGPFLATDLTERYLAEIATVSDWLPVLASSAHGHLALFGLIQISFGITMPYSVFGEKIKKWQTSFLVLGVVGIGPCMLIRALAGPSSSYDLLGITIGVLLSAAMLALISHSTGLFLKYSKSV